MAIQTRYSNIATLVIDDMPAQQTTLRGQLQMLHIQKVDVATSPDDAVRLIRHRAYGLIICDYHLNHRSDGQQLLEHLRDSALLAPDCLFFMVTAESSYGAVASASEHRPDAYLLKPITAGEVEDRLKALLDRRQALQPVHRRLARGDHAGAVAACDAIPAKKDRWAMQALQLKGQTLLQMGRPDEARAVYQDVLAVRSAIVWARLGLARSLKAGGRTGEALQLAQALLQSREGEKNVEAHDLVAACLEAQGDMPGALAVLRASAQVLPSARRQRIVGEAAFRSGDVQTACECYARVTAATAGTLAAQPQDVPAYAQALVDAGEAPLALRQLDAAARVQRGEVPPAGVLLAVRAQAQAACGDAAGALDSLARAREALRRARADFATVALARAELATGHEAEGMRLLGSALCADHENPRVRQLIGRALAHGGHEDRLEPLVDRSVGEIDRRIASARALFGESRVAEALGLIEAALDEFPENTGVLLQAAQMNCLALRQAPQHDAESVDRVRRYLARLDALMPGSDRVARMHRYFRETLSCLEGGRKTPQAA